MKMLTILLFCFLVSFSVSAEVTAVGRLDEAIRAEGIPINGVSTDTTGGVRSYSIDFKPSANPAQRRRASDIADAHDWSKSADSTEENDRKRAELILLKAELATV